MTNPMKSPKNPHQIPQKTCQESHTDVVNHVRFHPDGKLLSGAEASAFGSGGKGKPRIMGKSWTFLMGIL